MKNASLQYSWLLAIFLTERRFPVSRNLATTEIEELGWLDLHKEDWIPYPSQYEPRWKTQVAWARKNLSEHRLLTDQRCDKWELNEKGKEIGLKMIESFSTGKSQVSNFFLWSPVFKRYLDPSHTDCSFDIPRPDYLYNDNQPNFFSIT